MKVLVAALVGLALSGCASQQPLSKQTPSGKPEGDYPGKTANQVSSALTRFCNNNGFMVYESTDSTVICGKQRTGTSGIMTQALLGNSYSTTPVDKVRFSISKSDSGAHAWADMWVETQMVGGQMQQMPIVDNNSKNYTQYVLDNIKVY